MKRAPLDDLVAGAARYASDPNRVDQFTAHPATWLNRDGWEDEPLPARDQLAPSGTTSSSWLDVAHGPPGFADGQVIDGEVIPFPEFDR